MHGINSAERSGKTGQAMVEFVIIAGMLIAVVTILTVFWDVFQEYGARILDLVGSEYP